jgi:uncharacterized protein YjiK
MLKKNAVILLAACAVAGCTESEQRTTGYHVYQTAVKEPSDLCYNHAKTALFTVSDNTACIYEISFEGKTLRELPFNGKRYADGNDLEGITTNPQTKEIYVCSEANNAIFKLDSVGNYLQTVVHINVSKSVENNGLEGIAYGRDTLYLVNEKKPCLLIKYALSTDTWSSTQLNFANDLSGISYDFTDHTLWIISDESKAIYHTDLNGKVLFTQSHDIEQGEGIAVNREENFYYAVCDKTAKLYKIVISE